AVLLFIAPGNNFDETLAAMTKAAGGRCPESERLGQIRKYMVDSGSADSYTLDPSITRGLDYYTGIVYETFLNELPGIGSVCSGGRYDDLAGVYSAEKLCGVGSSIGLDRLIAGLQSLGRGENKKSYAELAIACVSEEHGGQYQLMAAKLREAGIACEVFLEPRKLTQQFIAAEKKGFRWVIIPGENPLEDPVAIRELESRTDRRDLSLEESIRFIAGNQQARI
ncbi:ATP phosphoribosyltransferase regulatory subunit, partial [Treponema sp. OttesenSCG-928-L16]|nr:ATP phosphoribosyltransferase regulatory subunit [Treponema sp. OttesenSCG-928-L16]